MSETVTVRQAQFVTAPRTSAGTAAIVGEAVTFATSGAASYLEMDNLLQQTVTQTSPTQTYKGVTDNFVTIAAITSTLYIIFGATAANVSGAHAPVVPNGSGGVGTISSGAYTRAAGTAFPIPAGTSIRFRLQKGIDNFMGFIATGAGFASLYQSSPANP